MQGYNDHIYVSFGLAQPKTTELARQLVFCCRTDSFFGDGVSSRRSTSMRDQSQCETTGSHIGIFSAGIMGCLCSYADARNAW